MKANGQITVIMPTYNARPDYLIAAIKSCQDQSWQNWELIVVDDGSTNQTPELVKAVAQTDERIHLLQHTFNRKLPAALNTGLAAASGAFITWLSDDDLLRPLALERMHHFLEVNPDYDLVYTDYSLIDADGQVYKAIKVGHTNELGIHKSTGICHLGRREVFMALGGYEEEFFLAEDMDFWIRACMRFQAAALHEDLALYRKHPATLSSVYRGAKVLRVHGRILDRYRHSMTWLDRSGLALAYLRLASKLLGTQDWRLGLCYLGKSLVQSPGVAFWKLVSRSFGSPPKA